MFWTATRARETAAKRLGGQNRRWAHVQRTAQLTRSRGGGSQSEKTLEMAAWLHDIGYSSALWETGMHAIDGARHLKRLGAPPVVVSLVAFHTGAEFEAEERGLLAELLEFDRPPQPILDQLILADLLSGPDGRAMAIHTRIDDMLMRYSPKHPVHRAITRSRGYLEASALRAGASSRQPM